LSASGWICVTNISSAVDRNHAPTFLEPIDARQRQRIDHEAQRLCFVATSAVVPLARLDAGALDHCRAGHVPSESGHRDLLRELKLSPPLDLNMRLGEASGAAVAILLARAALACHAGMATFAEAGVSGAED